jgi:PmbA protein
MQADLFPQVLAAARALGVSHIEATVTHESQALTRFANNTIHQNVAEESTELSVRPLIDGRTSRATTNCLDADGIRAVVREAVSLTRLLAADPDLPDLAGRAPAEPVARYFDSTASATPADRAEAVAEAIGIVAAAGQTAAGIYSTDSTRYAIYNSNGVSAEHAETMARFSITAMAGSSSGWAKASACDRHALHPSALARSAMSKAAGSSDPREVPAGRYTVILEPAATLDLVGQLFPDFSATAIRDERSFLTGRLGERLFGANITVTDDSCHPHQSGAPFDGEGVPRRPLALIENGVAREVACCRQTAALTGAAPTGHGLPLPNETGEVPANIVIAGGDTSLEQMIASTSRGILVTRLWYIREVDPFRKIFTGMTRDGTFLVEDGQIVTGVRNFRFNVGLIDLLNNVESLSPAVRASGEEIYDMVVPAMKVHGFNFTEVTRF